MATLSAISANVGYCKAPTLSWKVNTEIFHWFYISTALHMKSYMNPSCTEDAYYIIPRVAAAS
jgi:hypothetical protein